MRYSYSGGYYGSQANPAPYLIIAGILGIIGIAATWRIFTKADEKGWKCLIPIYSSFIYMRIAWNESKFWEIFLGGIGIGVLSLLLRLMGRFGLILNGIVALAWLCYMIYIAFKTGITCAHRFGKSTAFGVVGLVIFAPIGNLILGFGNADYDASRDYG